MSMVIACLVDAVRTAILPNSVGAIGDDNSLARRKPTPWTPPQEPQHALVLILFVDHHASHHIEDAAVAGSVGLKRRIVGIVDVDARSTV